MFSFSQTNIRSRDSTID